MTVAVKKEGTEQQPAAISQTTEQDRKPGQKYPTPTPGVGDRVFYETLFRQRPNSIMAREWCINYGVLSREEAKKELEKMEAYKEAMKQNKNSNPVKKKAKVLREVAGDVGMETSGGLETVTSSAL